MKILITGATGGYGNYALKKLLQLVPKNEIIALARNQEKAQKLEDQGVAVRIANYDDPQTLNTAFQGVTRLLFVSSSEIDKRQAQHQNIIAAAQKNGISYIAYTSFGEADTSTSPLAVDHAYTEKLILASGIEHTFLRNNWYLENEASLVAAALKTERFVHAGGDGKAGWGLKREFAEIGARAVSGKFNFPSILEVGGPLLTYHQLADALANVTDKKLAINATDAQASAKFLEDNADLPKNAAEFSASSQEIVKSGSLAIETDDMIKYLGHPLTPIEDAVKELFVS
ncbi:NAD(P)H-binding protein [Lactobacillus sp. ESL0684]|uniref:NmrA family NAD(P)-binding protein n=1 Tax=Lactobacillus sp. ESL0684 TaxID=2983213 RepID=UPI0023F6D55D|nr:NAD(P)H-binding protein [Lactobacillus sp. ESL0684]WEV43403.1 NAD(P)H-binding protein [Lactobacillus sp. ESL0684]